MGMLLMKLPYNCRALQPKLPTGGVCSMDSGACSMDGGDSPTGDSACSMDSGARATDSDNDSSTKGTCEI